MQEQQQEHLKTMMGTSGQLAYYGIQLPQQPLNVVVTEGGLGSDRANEDQNCVASIQMGQDVCVSEEATPQPSSVSSIINYLNVSSTSKSTMSSSVSISPITSAPSGFIASTSAPSGFIASTSAPSGFIASTSAPSGFIASTSAPSGFIASTSAPSGFIASTSTSHGNSSLRESILNTTANTDRSLGETVESTKMSSNENSGVSSSTSKASPLEKIGNNDVLRQKSPAPPTKMVTRSQTAAERMQPIGEQGELRCDQPTTFKHFRSLSNGSDMDEEYSPNKIKREMLTTAGITFDDMNYAKNPAGAGIEFGTVCPDCGAVAVTGVGWNAHQHAHRSDGTSCLFCNQVFLTEHGKQIHQQLHRDGQTRDVDDFCECGLCGGSFISILYLELHLLELHGRDALCEQRAICLGPSSSDPSCPPEDEGGQQLFMCGVCRSPFTFSLNLDCHMALHSEVSYCCALCDAAFPTLDTLVTHSKGHRFAAHAPTPPGMPLHMAQSPVPTRAPCPVFQSTPNATYNVWKPQTVKNTFHPRTLPQTSSGFVSQPTNVQANHHSATKVSQPSGTVKSSSLPLGGTSGMTTTGTPTVIAPMSPIMSSPLISAMNPLMSPPMTPTMTPVMTAPMTPAMLNYYMMMTLWGGNKSCENQGGIPMWQNYLNPSMANVFNYFNPYLLNNNNNINNSSASGSGHLSQTSCFRQEYSKDIETESSGGTGEKTNDCIVEGNRN